MLAAGPALSSCLTQVCQPLEFTITGTCGAAYEILRSFFSFFRREATPAVRQNASTPKTLSPPVPGA
jgi:hypothetical protein